MSARGRGLGLAALVAGGAALVALSAQKRGSAGAAARPAPSPAPPPVPVVGPDVVPAPAPPTPEGVQGYPPAGKPVLLSVMALRGIVPGYEGWRMVEWPGEPNAGGHPSWANYARALRDSEGRILPNLLRRYRAEDASQIVAVGFSAGANSGLRELMRHPKDRAALSAVVSLDGGHHTFKNWVRRPADDAPIEEIRNWYAAWNEQVEPVRGAVMDAATGSGLPLFVATASNVAAPTPTTTKTRQAWRDVFHDVSESLQIPIEEPRNDDGWVSSLMPKLEYAERLGDNALYLEFPGTDRAAHAYHANVLGPAILTHWVKPRLEPGTV